MRAAKIDANQNVIVDVLRSVGASVQILSSVGKGCPDLLVGYKKINILMEIKDGEKVPSKQALTPDQRVWHDEWKGQVVIVRSAEEALQILAELKGKS